jgi:2,4-dichlorophenol 6-monooxygenase
MVGLDKLSAILPITDHALTDHALITWFINPEGGAITKFDCGVLVQMGPTWGRHSEEWTLHFGFSLDDKDRFKEKKLVPRLRELLKLPDLDLEVVNYSHWVLERVVADKYRQGRIFIGGDAAHRRPPTSGLGLNTSIQDAHNIAWKLALVLKGKAAPSLLDTYEVERRPVGIDNSDWALFTFQNFSILNGAFGLMPNQPEANAARFKAVFEDSRMGRSMRAQIQEAINLQSVEFGQHNVEIGFFYQDSSAVASDGTEPAPADPLGKEYIPTTRPGHRLPHAWLERDGMVLSTHDLISRGTHHDFVLITDGRGDGWVEDVSRAARALDLDIAIARIQSRPFVLDGADFYEDREDVWKDLREIRDGGAILVRPDNFIAWRSKGPAVAGGHVLSDSLQAILGKGRPVANGTA